MKTFQSEKNRRGKRVPRNNSVGGNEGETLKKRKKNRGGRRKAGLAGLRGGVEIKKD